MRAVANKTSRRLWDPAFFAVATATVVLLASLGGCGKAAVPTGNVTGRVTAQGKPLSLGQVRLVKADGVPVGSAALTPAGEFQFDKPVPVGEYRVAIGPPGEAAPAGAPDPQLEQALKAIPPKYRHETTSGFVATVKEGDNAYRFDMK